MATSVEVDHDAMLTSFTGEVVNKVGGIHVGGTQPETATFPKGPVIYRYSIKHPWYSQASQKWR